MSTNLRYLQSKKAALEVAKLKEEIDQLRRPAIVRLSTWVALISAVGAGYAILTTDIEAKRVMLDKQLAIIEREKAEQQRAIAERKTTELEMRRIAIRSDLEAAKRQLIEASKQLASGNIEQAKKSVTLSGAAVSRAQLQGKFDYGVGASDVISYPMRLEGSAGGTAKSESDAGGSTGADVGGDAGRGR